MKVRNRSIVDMARSYMQNHLARTSPSSKDAAVGAYKSSVDHRLRKYGLIFDDLYDPLEVLDIIEAEKR